MRLAIRLLAAPVAIVTVCMSGWMLWTAGSWIGYGHPKVRAGSDTLVDAALPHPEVAEYHERLIDAAPASVFRAAERFSLHESPVVRVIFRTRAIVLGARHTDDGLSRPLLQQTLASGWSQLAHVSGREWVFGTVTQPWQADVRFRGLAADRFASFDSAGWVKIVWSIAVDSLGPHRARLRTETRVATTDRVARARFRRYWAMFSPGIVLIRREALRVIANDARR